MISNSRLYINKQEQEIINTLYIERTTNKKEYAKSDSRSELPRSGENDLTGMLLKVIKFKFIKIKS